MDAKMADNASPAYPADYYYPEFIYSRPDEPPTSPSVRVPFASVDNGSGSMGRAVTASTSVSPATTQRIRNASTAHQPTTRLVPDISTNQGLPDADMTKTVRADPSTSLVRNPAERNIPKLIVDDSVIRQTVEASKSNGMNLNNHVDQSNRYSQFNNGAMPGYTGYGSSDRTNLFGPGQQQQQQHTGRYIGDDPQAIDDRWKREVFIDEQGTVTIEPVVHEEPVYDGPFGLTRMGSYIFYIGMAIFTLIAAVFLIMCGVFYAQNYPDASNNAGKLAGIGICAFAFYLGLQLILIGIWHQKYQKEHPRPVVKSSQNDHSHLKSTKANVEKGDVHNNAYDYSYQPQTDYTSYETNPNASYAPFGNEQILIQGNPSGTAFYPPAAWSSNGELVPQPDPKFYQPMEWVYGPQTGTGGTATAERSPQNNKNDSGEKKKKTHRKNAVRADVSKATSNTRVAKPKVIDPPLPRLGKAPETKEIIAKTAELEDNLEQNTSTNSLSVQNVSRIKSIDDDDRHMSHSMEHRLRHSDRYPERNHHSHRHHQHQHHQHHHHSHRRHESHSPCSICSRKEFHSDVGHDHRHHHVTLVTTQGPSTKMYRDSGVATEEQLKITKDTSVTADLEDISNDQNNTLSQVPVVRRTVIVEPYPAEPSTQITLTPRINAARQFHSDEHLQINGTDDKIMYPRVPFQSTKPKGRKSTTESRDNILEDLNLDNVDEIDFSEGPSDRRKVKKVSPKKTMSNAFYNN